MYLLGEAPENPVTGFSIQNEHHKEETLKISLVGHVGLPVSAQDSS